MHRRVYGQSRRRVALYSHDTQGLGHIRRNIAIASALVESNPATDVLLLSGAPEVSALPLPPSTDTVTVPALHKGIDGHYSPRALGTSLDDLLHLRAQIIESAVAAFEPDLLIVDKVARGVGGELDPTLRTLRGTGTKVVLGLRDVLDSPRVTLREWRADGVVAAVRDLYDEIWVYGDPTVYDPVSAYGWPWPVQRKVVYTGYLANRQTYAPAPGRQPAAEAVPPPDPYVLCLVGGGQDGAELAGAFLQAALPNGHSGALVTGPYLPSSSRHELHRIAEKRLDMSIYGFVPRVEKFIASAAATVTMGGYNSVCELMEARCPTLVVPRIAPRMEQALRTEALSQAGWLDVLSPEDLSPKRVGDWMAEAVTRAPRPRRPVDLDGLSRIPVLVDALLKERSPGVDHAVV